MFDRLIAYQEHYLGVPLDYLRFIARASRRAFFKFGLFMPMARHRRALPPDALHTAHLVATLHQDCGTCVQISVNLALRDGVPADTLRAVLEGRVEALDPELAEVYHFASAVVAQEDAEPLRRRLLARYGPEGLVELAFTLAAAQVFPVTKRALGYAKRCALVQPDLEKAEAA